MRYFTRCKMEKLGPNVTFRLKAIYERIFAPHQPPVQRDTETFTSFPISINCCCALVTVNFSETMIMIM